MGAGLARLGRLHDAMARHVAEGRAPGIVTAIWRRGELHLDAIGTMAMGSPAKMAPDTIFRIASLSKPVTAAATMILVEECKLALDEPVTRLLPELADRKVLRNMDGPLDDTMPAARPITVRDLLTFRPGWGMKFGPPDTPFQKAVAELGIVGFGPPQHQTKIGPDEWLAKLGTLPLMCQPGERWLYNTGSYVLSVLVARASGMGFESFLAERLFDPLGMKDTGFHVPPAKLRRLATAYRPDAKTGVLNEIDSADAKSQVATPPLFPDGAGGLVSTAEDYLAFGRMLLDGGKARGGRILSRPSVETMTTDQLTPAQKALPAFGPTQWDNRGWGLGVEITTRRDDISATPGQYGWVGGYGTAWRNDPREEMIAVLMTQRSEFPLFSSVHRDFWTATYQAIDD